MQQFYVYTNSSPQWDSCYTSIRVMWWMNTNATFKFMAVFYNLPVEWLPYSIFSDVLFINGKQRSTVSSGWPHIYVVWKQSFVLYTGR